jgi:hypothetical protein
MHLIYINEIGSDYKGQKQYEFIFSETFEIDMGDWFQIPASATQRSKSPDVEYVNLVGLLKNTDLKLELETTKDCLTSTQQRFEVFKTSVKVPKKRSFFQKLVGAKADSVDVEKIDSIQK